MTPDIFGASFRIRYAEGETGWAKWLGKMRAKIDNLPVCEGLNIGDIVTVVDDVPDAIPRVGKVVKRQWSERTSIRYEAPYERNFAMIVGAMRALDLPVEGLTEGFAIVAHNDDVDPLKILKEKLKMTVSGTSKGGTP